MTVDEVRAVVEKVLPVLTRQLCIEHWGVRVTFDLGHKPDPETGWAPTAEVYRQPDYEQARVRMNPDGPDDAREVVSDLRHELCHVVLSDFEPAIDMLGEAWRGRKNRAARRALSLAITRAREQAVIRLERIHDGAWGLDAVLREAGLAPAEVPGAAQEGLRPEVKTGGTEYRRETTSPK